MSGKACPLGVSQTDKGFNFAINAPSAKQIFIHFFTLDNETFVNKVELVERKGSVFFGSFEGVDSSWLYAVQAIQKNEHKALLFDDKLLLDPYAKAINKPQYWDEHLYSSNDPNFIVKAKLKVEEFDWQGAEKPNIKNSETIL